MRKYHLFLLSFLFICFSCKEKTQQQPVEKAAPETNKEVIPPKALMFVSDHAHILTTEHVTGRLLLRLVDGFAWNLSILTWKRKL